MRRTALAVAGLLAAGCGSSSSEAEVAADALTAAADARGELRLNWQRNIGALSELLRPTANGDIVCATNARGESFFLNLSDGGDASPPFQMQDIGGSITGAAGCDGGVVAAAAENGLLLAYTMDGKELWRKNLKTRITSPPLVSAGSVFALGHDGRLSAYSARLGDSLWRYVSPLKNLLRTPLDSSPVATGNLIVAGIDNGVVVALRRDTGRVAWNTRMARARNSHSFANILDVTTPVLRGDLVCAAAYQGHIGCMRADSGELLWRAPLSASRRVTIDRDGARVFAIDIDGDAYGFSARDGELLWRRKLGAATAAAFVRGALMVGMENNTLLALAPDDGRTLTFMNMTGRATYLAPLDDDSVLGATLGGGVFRASFVF